MKATQKGRICHTLISHWLRNLFYVGVELTLHITFGALNVYYNVSTKHTPKHLVSAQHSLGTASIQFNSFNAILRSIHPIVFSVRAAGFVTAAKCAVWWVNPGAQIFFFFLVSPAGSKFFSQLYPQDSFLRAVFLLKSADQGVESQSSTTACSEKGE